MRGGGMLVGDLWPRPPARGLALDRSLESRDRDNYYSKQYLNRNKMLPKPNIIGNTRCGLVAIEEEVCLDTVDPC